MDYNIVAVIGGFLLDNGFNEGDFLRRGGMTAALWDLASRPAKGVI